MSFRTLMTVTGPRGGSGDLESVAALAAEVDAHLAILVVGITTPPPVGEVGIIVPEIWAQERERELTELQDRMHALTDWIAENTPSGDVAGEYADRGWVDDVIGRRARYADLVVAGLELRADKVLWEKVAEGVLFASGCPLMVLPDNGRATLKASRIVIAWDHRPEVARATRAALPLLKTAADVRLVLVDPFADEFRHGAEPGADVATWLARHGAKVTVERLPSGAGVAPTISRFATDFDADLLVMGAYGHSRLRERIFGGVTRALLKAPPVPLFLSR